MHGYLLIWFNSMTKADRHAALCVQHATLFHFSLHFLSSIDRSRVVAGDGRRQQRLNHGKAITNFCLLDGAKIASKPIFCHEPLLNGAKIASKPVYNNNNNNNNNIAFCPKRVGVG
jgi:hypothetical protein